VDTLSADVQSICQRFNWDCTDETLHIRTNIQHSNYDEYAACGSGCSGNPFDASWDMTPIGWGESHELGHNLQTKALNAHYVSAADRNKWASYQNRAGENSNNVFPYNTLWRYHRIVKNSNLEVRDDHMNHLDQFALIQSDLQNLTRVVGGVSKKVLFNRQCGIKASYDFATTDNRYEGIWLDSGYAADNGLRMSFLLQMPVLLDDKVMRDGTVLRNGFDIYTVLYSQSRLFYRAAQSQATWDAARAALGFGLFPYNGNAVYGGATVRDMPGNDYLLVALAYITGKDWRTYFDLRGVRYSDLAIQQVEAHIAAGLVTSAVGDEFVVLEDDLPGMDLSAAPTVRLDGVSVWPRNNWNPSACP
jgi:immunomodulating metalloprotease